MMISQVIYHGRQNTKNIPENAAAITIYSTSELPLFLTLLFTAKFLVQQNECAGMVFSFVKTSASTDCFCGNTPGFLPAD